MNNIIKILLVLLMPIAVLGQEFKLQSPDKKIEAKIKIDEGITWQLSHNNEIFISPSKIEMKVNENNFWGKNSELIHSEKGSENSVIAPVYQIRAKIQDNYNYLFLNFKDFAVEFRMYNNGFAYRFKSNIDKDLIVNNEVAEFKIAQVDDVYFARTSAYQQPFEGEYHRYNSSEISEGEFSITPVTFSIASGLKIVVTDANIISYPGMFLEKTIENGFMGKFAPYVSKEKIQTIGKLSPVKMPYYTKMMAKSREDFLAKTYGARAFPWRVVLIEETEKDLMDNTIVYQLAPACKIEDTSWIKPGIVVWDWYHYWKIPGVDFRSGVNNQTYRYYIDFAAENGFEYINVDFSWSPLLKLDKPKSKIGLHDIIKYAKAKDVGVFIWVVWYELDSKMDYYLDLFEKWGVAGLKVDFMDRDDQRVVEFYHRLAEEAAKRKLLLNLHGAYKPDGISRTWPNLVNREGVIGLENNKFGEAATPEHNLTLPFTRNVAGPVDYTPGAMRHTTPDNYKKSWANPHSMTTRCQQLAMYIVYYGPIQMIADAPTLYPEKTLTFLREVPTTWDETLPLDAKIGQKAIIARKSKDRWFIGGMCASEPVLQVISTDFLTSGTFKVKTWRDGENLEDIVFEEKTIQSGQPLTIQMKPNGGTVIIIEPVN